MKKNALLLITSLFALVLSSCDGEYISVSSSSSSFEFDYYGYSFSGIDEGEDSYRSDIDNSLVSRDPFSTSYSEDDYVDPFLTSSEESSSSSSQEASVYEESSSSEEKNPYANLDFAILDLPSTLDLSSLKRIEDPAMYSSLALDLASNEIKAAGFEVFRAYAVIPDKLNEDVERLIPGLAFTQNGIYATDEETVAYSCGFMQVIEKDEKPEILLDEELASQGLIVLPKNENDSRLFVIEGNIFLDGFSGIKNGVYFSYEQIAPFQIEISVKKAEGRIADYADENLDLYDFDKGEYLYKASLFGRDKSIEAFAIYGEKAKKAYENAIEAMNQAIKLQDERGYSFSLSSFVIFSYDLWLSMQTAEQEEAINDVLVTSLENIQLKQNQYLVVGRDGGIEVATDYSYASGNDRMADGILKSLFGIGMIAGGFICILATAGTTAPAIIGLMCAGAAINFTCGLSDTIEGFQDVIYGAKGDVTSESINLVKGSLKNIFGEEAAEKIYFAAKIVGGLLAAFMGPVNTALQVSSAINASIFETVIAVARAVVVKAVKVAISIGASQYVNKISQDIAKGLGASDSLAKLVGFGTSLIAGLLVYRALDAIDAKFNLSGFNDPRPEIPEEDKRPVPGEEVPPTQGRRDLGDAVKVLDYTKEGHGMVYSYSRDIVGNVGSNLDIKYPTSVRIVSDSSVDYGLELPFLQAGGNDLSLVQGFYNPYSREIVIFESAFENSAAAIRTIAHLMRHAYQLENANFLSPVIQSMKSENYVSPDRSFIEYMHQESEIDAEAYADYILEKAYASYEGHDDLPPFPDPESFFAGGAL